jgi:hypothetical protein
MRAMDKATLLREIRETHAFIETATAEMDDDALLGPAPGMDGWTRKDVLAHVEWWSRHSASVVEGTRSGVDPYPGDDEPWDPDAWNERILAENRDRTPEDVRRGEAEAFRRLVAAVEGATDAELFTENPHPWLDGTLAETVIEDSSKHYPDHVAQLI